MAGVDNLIAVRLGDLTRMQLRRVPALTERQHPDECHVGVPVRWRQSQEIEPSASGDPTATPTPPKPSPGSTWGRYEKAIGFAGVGCHRCATRSWPGSWPG